MFEQKKLNILIVTVNAHFGGIENVVYSLYKNFKNSCHEVDFVVTEVEGELSEKLIAEGVRVESCVGLNKFKQILYSIKYLKKNNYDVIFLNHAKVFQCVLGVLDNNTSVFPVIHSDNEIHYRVGLSNPDAWNAVICDSPKIHETAKSLCLNQNIICIPNCIEVNNELYQNRAKFDTPLRLLFVGRLSQHEKNLIICPDILKHCLDKGINVNLSFVGDGPDKHLLDNKIKELNLEKYVTFHGRKSNSETLEIMRNSHILLMPSFFEGFPIVLLEAMSCGCVPIASTLPGITDVVINSGENGYLADINDVRTFTEPIKDLLENPDRWKIMSQNAFETVSSNYSIDVMLNKYMETISNGLSGIYNPAKPRTTSIDLSTFKIYYKSPKWVQKPMSSVMSLFAAFYTSIVK